MLESELIISHSIFTNKKVYALFLGSGVSRSAGIPTGWGIVEHLIQKIASFRNEPCVPTPEKWFINTFNKEPDYSNLLEELTSTQEERVNLLRPYFEPNEEELTDKLKQPTIAHRKIAALVKKGYIKVIITTNFDRLIENALREIGVEPTVISNPNHVENAMPLMHSDITVIKINGDYLDTKFLNIKSELSKYDDKLEELLKEVFENFGLITCGWSAKWDLALVELIKSAHKFRFSSFFTYVRNYDDEFKQLAEYRKGKMVLINDADSFFNEIYENVDAMERNEIEHPLTKEIAIARLKKYVVSEVNKIQLNDLLMNITDDVVQKLNIVDKQASSEENKKKRLDYYQQQIDIINDIYVHGIYWGKQSHYAIWIKSFLKIFNYKKYGSGNNNIIDGWSELDVYQILLAFYSIGMTSILREDFKMLKELLSLKIKELEHGGKINITKVINNNRAVLNIKFIEINKQYPMSDLLHSALQPYFTSFLPTTSDYNEVFDYLEIIISLTYHNNQFGGDWMPRGMFMHRVDNQSVKDHPYFAKYDELEREKENFELVKYNLFPNYESIKLSFDALKKLPLGRYFQ